MAKSGSSFEKNREDQSLGDQIVEVFNDRVNRLDQIQNAKTVTQADFDFLKETRSILVDFDQRNTGDLDKSSAAFLENLRVMLDAADNQADRVDLVDEERGAKQEEKKKEEAAKNFEGDELAEAWSAAVRELEEALDGAEAESSSTEKRRSFDRIRSQYELFVEHGYNARFDALESAGKDANNDPLLKAFGVRVDRLAGRLDAYYATETDEVIQYRFREEIRQLDGEINTLLDMSLETAEDVAAARELFEDIKYFVGVKDRGKDPEIGYTVDWRNQVGPILDEFKVQNQRWGDEWRNLVQAHQHLMDRFFGSKPKEGESRNGVLQAYGRRLRERSREVQAEIWNREFPDFALFVSKTIINIQDARMRRGEERIQAMASIADSVNAIQGEWNALRRSGPRLSQQEREMGVRSVVNQYDILLRDVKRDVTALVRTAPTARPARLDDVAYVWRGALVRTVEFWQIGTEFKDKIAFLRRYESGEASEEEIAKMIRSAERENFEAVAESDVLDDLRERSEQKQERREQTERRERASLYHPKLELLRMDAKNMYRNVLKATFWKDDVPRNRREALFAADVKIEDAELGEFVTDIPAYRRMVGMVNSAYQRVAEVEDPLYAEGKQPEGTVRARQLRRVIDRYLDAERREAQAWRAAKHSRAWGIDLSRRDRVLHYEFNQFWRLGERAFRDTEFLKAPSELRNAIVTWIFVRARLRTLGEYTQWLIDENPALAQSVKNMPTVFSVPEKEEQEESESDEVGVEGISEADKAELALPAREEPTGDDAGGGAFTELETVAAADTASRDEEGEEGETSESGDEGREAALEKHSRDIVKALIE